jgi:hypothetical protein
MQLILDMRDAMTEAGFRALALAPFVARVLGD